MNGCSGCPSCDHWNKRFGETYVDYVQEKKKVAVLEGLLREVMAEPEHVTLGWMDRANAALREKP